MILQPGFRKNLKQDKQEPLTTDASRVSSLSHNSQVHESIDPWSTLAPQAPDHNKVQDLITRM